MNFDWANCTRSDLVLLEAALKDRRIPAEEVPGILAAVQEKAKTSNERFQARTRRLVALYGPPQTPEEATERLLGYQPGTGGSPAA